MGRPKYKILIVEDDYRSALLFKNILEKSGYEVEIAPNGENACKMIEAENFDVIISDWMMPVMNGIELLRYLSNVTFRKKPYIIMLTAMISDEAKEYAIKSGANVFYPKPIKNKDLIEAVKEGIGIIHTRPKSKLSQDIEVYKSIPLPPFPVCVIASSTGGPKDVLQMLKQTQSNRECVYFLVQHGPVWMLEAFADRITKETDFTAELTEHGKTIKPGILYVAVGDKHTVLKDNSLTLELNTNPKENYVRPAADPLMRSIAKKFGEYALGVVMTGLGHDGMNGAQTIAKNGGKILVQDPKTCIAPSMPESVIKSGIKSEILNLKSLANRMSGIINMNYLHIQRKKR